MNTTTNPEQLIDVICNRTMHYAAEMARKCPTVDYGKLSRALKEQVKAGYPGLIAELKEANDAFFGAEPMLNTVMNVGCLKLAADAWKQYQDERAA